MIDARTCEGCMHDRNDTVTVNGQRRGTVHYCNKDSYDWDKNVPQDCERLGEYDTLRKLREL